MGEKSHKDILQKLFASFSELEKAISSARNSLSNRESVPNQIFERLNTYDSILEQQREMAFDLCRQLDLGRTDHIKSTVAKINGLSQLIRDDARETLSLLNPANNTADNAEIIESESFDKKDALIC